MAYGVGAEVEKLVWGNTRPTPPAVVATALQAATDIINDNLNIRVELTGNDIPPKFATIAQLLAAGIIQEQRKPEAKSQNTLRGEKLLDGIKDEVTESSSEDSFHLGFLDDE
jgi:hypothetical protein